MKNKLSIILLILLYVANVFANPRKVESLSGSWQFAVDSLKIGEKVSWQNGLPANLVREVKVPHTWNTLAGLEEYNGRAWYQKSVQVPVEWKGKSIRLKFDAIYRDAVVYVNGKKAAQHFYSGFTPFSLKVDQYFNYGASNLIVVSVSNDYTEKAFPYSKSFDWVNDGGIIRNVSLQVTGTPSLRYVHVTPILNLSDSTGKTNVAVCLWERDVKKVSLQIKGKEKGTGKIIFDKQLTLKTRDSVFRTSFDLGKVNPWHFDNPSLYEVEVVLIDKGQTTDNKTSAFGFRKIELKGDKQLLNKEEVRLPGLEYMPSSNPSYGAAEPVSFMDSVVRMMKDLNVVITRFHWQQDDAMLDLMDKYGILAQEEMPWRQSPGNLTPQLFDVAKMQLAENIEEHYNHPCIFAWGLSNEVYGNTDKDVYRNLKSFTRNLDSSRLVTIVSNEIHSRMENDESLIGDLPTWNEYVGTWFTNDRNNLPEFFKKAEAAIDGKPLLITENGLCEPRFTGGDARRVDELFYHYNEWGKRSYVVGYIYFCLNDYRTHVGEEGLGKFKIRRHGLTDMYMQPKPSYYTFKQLSSPVEIIKVEALGKTGVKVGLRSKNQIPSYTLRNYKVVWKTMDGKIKEKIVPSLKPGESIELELENINPRFSFEVLRPNGFITMRY